MITWKYSPKRTTTTKHAFYEARPTVAICGVTMPWYERYQFETDKEGLASRKECKRCLDLLNNDHQPIMARLHPSKAPAQRTPGQRPNEDSAEDRSQGPGYLSQGPG